MHNKKECKIADIVPSKMENLLLSDEDVPSLDLGNVHLRRCLFIRVRMKKAKMRESSFIHCVFEDCYFRDAEFTGVNFTDSYFKDCNLHKASFSGCCLWYVRFSRCSLDYDRILQSLPSETGIAVRLLRSLRQNAIEMGERRMADKILMKEIEIEKQELKNQFLAHSDYYQSRYDWFERIKGGVKFLFLVLSGLIWGHGLKLRNLFLTASIVIIAFAFLLSKFGEFVTAVKPDIPIKLNLCKALYLSVITFTTLGYGDFTPASISAYIICAGESLLGIVFLGFLAATVYRRFSR